MSVVILGSGVIGLTIAHVLSNNPSLQITIVARDLPEDLHSQAWASPWAGANWSPMGQYDERIFKWETLTFNKFWDMIPIGIAMELPSRVFVGYEADIVEKVWWKHLVRNFRIISSDDVPAKYKSGVAFSTFSVNPQFYLPWLKSQLEPRGVKFIHKYVASLEEAALYGDVIINATGLGARSLIGVADDAVFPIRGQGIIVDCPGLKDFIAASDSATPARPTYIITRPGDGTSILGGTLFDNVWDTSIDYSVAKSIFTRCAELAPQLNSPDTKILGHTVGLRPARNGGERVEAEWVDLPLKDDLVPRQQTIPRKKQLVIHAYGLGAAGFQRSWGVAEEVSMILLKESRT